MADSTQTRRARQAGDVSIWHAETLDVEKLLGEYGQRVGEGALWIGHCVYVGLADDARCRHAGCVPLKAAYLRKIIGRHHLDAVRRAALDVGYVERDCSYQAGRRSQAYRLLPPHDCARAVRREIADFSLRRNVALWRESRRRKTTKAECVDTQVCEHLRRNLRRVRISSAIDFDESLSAGKLAARQIAVENLRCGELWLVVDAFGRIHTPITNLPKELRAYLTVDGKRLANVDVGEAQPLFLALFLRENARLQESKNLRNQGHPPAHPYDGQSMMDNRPQEEVDLDRTALPADLRRYLELCENRGFYQAVASKLNMHRADVKKRVLATLFDRPWRRNAISGVLGELFPAVVQNMREIKRGNYRRLAHTAQRIESAFMFGRVVPRIMAERPKMFVSTIHDSILTTAENAEYVRGVMLAEFARLGVTPQVQVEPC